MQQKINITELLRNAPKGTKLYSPIYGDVYFVETRYGNTSAENEHAISAQNDYAILCNLYRHLDKGTEIGFDPFGCLYRTEEANVMLFPSKDCRTWENFKTPWKHKHFEPFQKVLVQGTRPYNPEIIWLPNVYSFWDEKYNVHRVIYHGGDGFGDYAIIPYEGNESLLGKEVE